MVERSLDKREVRRSILRWSIQIQSERGDPIILFFGGNHLIPYKADNGSRLRAVNSGHTGFDFVKSIDVVQPLVT